MKTFIKFPGLDGHQIALDKHNITHVVSSTLNSKDVTNIYFQNTTWISVALNLDETVALIEGGNDAYQRDEAEHWRKVAEWKRKAKVDVEAAIKESDLFTNKYKKSSHRIESLSDGSKVIHILLEPSNKFVMSEPEHSKVEELREEVEARHEVAMQYESEEKDGQ